MKHGTTRDESRSSYEIALRTKLFTGKSLVSDCNALAYCEGNKKESVEVECNKMYF